MCQVVYLRKYIILLDLYQLTSYSSITGQVQKNFSPGVTKVKNLVRAFVAALVLTGTVATAHSAQKGAIVTATVGNALPVPSCPPDDPNGCGISGTK